MPNNVELCRQSVMQGVSSAVELDSDGQWMVRLQGVRPSRNTSSVFDKSTSELEIAMAILRQKDELRNIKYLRKTKFTYV